MVIVDSAGVRDAGEICQKPILRTQAQAVSGCNAMRPRRSVRCKSIKIMEQNERKLIQFNIERRRLGSFVGLSAIGSDRSSLDGALRFSS